jgi:hypothetical protein
LSIWLAGASRQGGYRNESDKNDSVGAYGGHPKMLMAGLAGMLEAFFDDCGNFVQLLPPRSET